MFHLQRIGQKNVLPHCLPLFPFSFQLVLKHRQGKNHKMRIVVFVGSPVEADDKDVSWIYKLSFFILE